MSTSANVQINLSLNNTASSGLNQALQQTTSATQRASAQSAAATARGATMQRSAFQRMSQAREQLGIRSERTIQREIDRTSASYNRLARSGTMSWREQARAAQAMRQRVTELTNEMGKLTARQKAMGALKIGAAGVAGVSAAAYTLKDPAQRAIDFDYRLAGMANTAFAGQDLGSKKAGMKTLEDAINNAVKSGGGARESAAGALDKIIASGAVGTDDAMKMLPQLVKAATASGADVSELANIGIRAMQSFGITAEELPNVLNMAISAGQAGGFELRDMARWLPQQMAAAGLSGLKGRSDFAAIASLNQAAAITAGSQDEAGNNVANILRKINSQDTAGRVKQVMGINLSKYLQDAREKRGINSIDAFGELIKRSVEKDPRYKALQKQLSGAKTDDERRATLESMSSIAQGSSIGKIVHDQQAMMALIAMLNNQDYMKDVRKEVLANDVATGGVIDQNYELLAGTTGFKLQQAAEMKDIAQKKALDELTPTIGNVAESFSKITEEYPGLIGAMTLATTALTALAGAAGLASLMMGGKGIGLGRIGTGIAGAGRGIASGVAGAGRGIAAGVSSTAAGLGNAARGMGVARLAGGVAKGGLIGVGTAVGGYALEKTFGEESAVARYGGSALTGAGIGATIGSIVPVVGTAVGAAVGGALGLAWEGLSDLFSSKEEEIRNDLQPPEPQEQPPVDINATLTLGLAPGLVVQRQAVQAEGVNFKLNTGNIVSGAPG
jgi:hypothetical protein